MVYPYVPFFLILLLLAALSSSTSAWNWKQMAEPLYVVLGTMLYLYIYLILLKTLDILSNYVWWLPLKVIQFLRELRKPSPNPLAQHWETHLLHSDIRNIWTLPHQLSPGHAMNPENLKNKKRFTYSLFRYTQYNEIKSPQR